MNRLGRERNKQRKSLFITSEEEDENRKNRNRKPMAVQADLITRFNIEQPQSWVRRVPKRSDLQAKEKTADVGKPLRAAGAPSQGVRGLAFAAEKTDERYPSPASTACE